MRMLSQPVYSLYVTYPNGNYHKLESHECPLMVQLNWAVDNSDGRFLVKNEGQIFYLKFIYEYFNIKNKFTINLLLKISMKKVTNILSLKCELIFMAWKTKIRVSKKVQRKRRTRKNKGTKNPISPKSSTTKSANQILPEQSPTLTLLSKSAGNKR